MWNIQRFAALFGLFMLQLRNRFLPPNTYFQICRWRANSTRRSKECGNPTVVARHVPVAANASFRRKSMCTTRSIQQQYTHKLLGDKVVDPPTWKNTFPKYPPENSQENALKGSKICKHFFRIPYRNITPPPLSLLLWQCTELWAEETREWCNHTDNRCFLPSCLVLGWLGCFDCCCVGIGRGRRRRKEEWWRDPSHSRVGLCRQGVNGAFFGLLLGTYGTFFRISFY